MSFQMTAAHVVLLCIASLASRCFGAGTDSSLNVRLIAGSDGAVQAQIEGKAAIPLRDFQKGAVINGVLFSTDESGQWVTLSHPNQKIRLEADGFGGFSALLEASNQFAVRLDKKLSVIDMFTPSNNTAAVKLEFHDGGRAEMEGGSRARYDVFLDQSYYVSGRGKIHTVDADGLRRDLSEFFPPMTGGPLRRVVDEKGAARWERLSPVRDVIIGGPAGGNLEIYVSTNKIWLPGKEQKRVELPHGAVIDLIKNPFNRNLDWKIPKGYFRIWLAGFDCWNAISFTEQHCSMVWDVTQGAVDLSNYTPTNIYQPNLDPLVIIARRITTCVHPQVTFQYLSIYGCNTFIGSAQGGDVEVYNPDTGRATTVSQGNRTFQRGMADGAATAPRNQLRVNWDDTSVNLSGTPGRFRVPANSRELITGENATQMEVDYGANRDITLRALQSELGVRLEPLQDWSFNLDEGNRISFSFDVNRGVFIGTASADNSSPVPFTGPDGMLFSVEPGGIITIIPPQPGSLLWHTEGGVVFYEAEGGGGGRAAYGTATPAHIPPPSGQPPLGFWRWQPGFDPALVPPPRVPSPPVTVKGP